MGLSRILRYIFETYLLSLKIDGLTGTRGSALWNWISAEDGFSVQVAGTIRDE